MGKKCRASRRKRRDEEFLSDDSSDSKDADFLPEVYSSEDDEEVLEAREKVKKYCRGWESVALLNESDKEDDTTRGAAATENITMDTGEVEPGDVEKDAGDVELDTAAVEAELDDGVESNGICSDYFNSSDPGSYTDSTDENVDLKDDAVRKKSRFPKFNQHIGIPNFELSMLFDSNEAFKDSVTTYAIKTRHDIRFTKNEPSRCRAKGFGGADCPWHIFASFNKDIDSFQIKTYVAEHTCEPKRGLKRLTTKFLVSKFYDLVAAHPDIKIRYLKPFMEKSLELDVNLTRCKRVKKTILADLVGNCIKEYGKLRDYAEELVHSNPGTTVHMLTDRENVNDKPTFKAFYCCLNSCKEGVLNGCRPVLGIDGCFLKGLVKGELLTAIGRDGNNQMFPVAWAVVQVENTETWTWFLNLLKHDLRSADGEGWTLISDRQKGLVGAVADTWSKAEHRFCCRHLYANWCKTYSGRQLKNLFWALAKCTNKSDFNLKYKELEKVHPAAAKDLLLVDPKYWCKAYFSPFSKCDSCDNNLCEAFNGTIVEARNKSIISMLEDIRRAVMRRIRDKRLAVSIWKADFGPLIQKKLQNNVKESYMWMSEWNGGCSYEVKCGRSQYVVRLREGTCSCGAWELSGIPCTHAIRAIHDNGDKAEEYINLWYKQTTYLRAYSKPLEPIRGENIWPRSEQEEVVPPKLRKMPGRPKKKRRREFHENIGKTKMTRQGRKMTCHVCGGKGHNARSKTCPCKSTSSSQISDLTTAPTRATASMPLHQESGSTASMPLHKGRASAVANDRYISPLHKECRPKTKPKKRTGLTGLGIYINPETGQSILNPGTSMSRVIDCGSQNTKSKKNSSQEQGEGGS